jgi:hypothetical protein
MSGFSGFSKLHGLQLLCAVKASGSQLSEASLNSVQTSQPSPDLQLEEQCRRRFSMAMFDTFSFDVFSRERNACPQHQWRIPKGKIASKDDELDSRRIIDHKFGSLVFPGRSLAVGINASAKTEGNLKRVRIAQLRSRNRNLEED